MKFFRNIRKRFLYKNKFSKYLGYALGEITLVVIGILIALAINNRNQDRINEKNEQIYLTGLREEFQTSKLKLTELIAVNQANYIGAKEILRYTTANELPVEIVFSTLLYNTFSSDVAFNPNNSLLLEMINSGNLKNLSNTELRKQLTNWTATLEDISRQEEELAIQREKVLDMFRKNESSLSTIFKQAGVYDDLDLPKSRNDVSNLGLLKSTEFENNILMFILTSYATEKAHYYPLMQDIDGILELIQNVRK
ncbi:hypothetical protein GCM10007103_04250 [Salinimicrobium marinum]|uniref:Uncharacterized protein n=1 Tax=Salinimicrobium marinum TaxID=680283 RepID=A0A918VV62_9FLAO|nr:DUF6090 family protein [Salinimicrobium marinum]GHA26096.1 hypothetical protein GCM10007103_04250 [Salinimicrobium marinum]